MLSAPADLVNKTEVQRLYFTAKPVSDYDQSSAAGKDKMRRDWREACSAWGCVEKQEDAFMHTAPRLYCRFHIAYLQFHHPELRYSFLQKTSNGKAREECIKTKLFASLKYAPSRSRVVHECKVQDLDNIFPNASCTTNFDDWNETSGMHIHELMEHEDKIFNRRKNTS